MKTVIGLFSKNGDVQRAIQRLQEANLPIDSISMLTSETAVRDVLSGHQKQELTKYAVWGLGLSILFFALYSLAGLVCDCGLMVYNIWIELETLILFIAIGAALGLLIAYYMHVERLNDSIRPYTWNVYQGSAVVVVHTNNEQVATVVDILHHQNGAAIKTLETRLQHSFRNGQSQYKAQG
ncbi:MAG: hypothetical protein GY796_35335 [Chloroflexi bacterium]|nr:hypothetical protein [Chloroflexota bacterium]